MNQIRAKVIYDNENTGLMGRFMAGDTDNS
jgi:hypothetical protein